MTDVPADFPGSEQDGVPMDPDVEAPAQPGEDPGSIGDDAPVGGSDAGGEAPI